MIETCKYCSSEYHPRPQVKNPQACKNRTCQQQRQRDNEREWHRNNDSRYDAAYHLKLRIKRNKKLKILRNNLTTAFETGATFHQFQVSNFSELVEQFCGFLSKLGSSELNKFCNP